MATVLPPPQPSYIFRGHASAVHAVRFSPFNHRLLTGDADGWVVSWSLATKRPEASWRAHSNAVLGLAWWDADTVITHGRDNKLLVWRLTAADEATLPKLLPLDHAAPSTADAPSAGSPVVLHEMTVNTLNFCAFAHYLLPAGSTPTPRSSDLSPAPAPAPLDAKPPLLLAVPHTLDSEAIDIHQLPGSARLATVRSPELSKPAAGLTMALTFLSADVLVAGHEGGQVLAYARPVESTGPAEWACVYRARPHTQPVLSVAAFAGGREWVSTAADAVAAKHSLPPESLRDVTPDGEGSVPEVSPLKVVKTGHAGQQGVRVRDDGKVCATAGWDKRVRVYAGEGLREVAVLKWHREGCYAVDFASVLPRTEVESMTRGEVQGGYHKALEGGDEGGESSEGTMQQRSEVDDTVMRSAPTLTAQKREGRVRSTHWLAVGSKDGRVSLWDIF